MMDAAAALDRYLEQHFLRAEDFAAHCGIDAAALDELAARHCVPAASYVVADGTLYSHVFGVTAAPGARAGRYFPPAHRSWVERARQLAARHGIDATPMLMRRVFAANMAQALRELDRDVWRLRDSFDDAGLPLCAGLQRRIDLMWEHFLHGTFGLCVADPASEAAIAHKEVLQEKLDALAGAGHCDGDAMRELHALIAAFAAACSPFSPLDYPRSTRKRLVDDLRARLPA